MFPIALLITYTVFIFLQVAHTLEEIGSGVFELEVGGHAVGKKRYLRMATLLSGITILPLVLMLAGIRFGLYLALFTSGFIGVLQAVVHTVGFIRSGSTRETLGVGFYSAIPLAIVGAGVLVQVIRLLGGYL